jgi:hypothetical protein
VASSHALYILPSASQPCLRESAETARLSGLGDRQARSSVR